MLYFGYILSVLGYIEISVGLLDENPLRFQGGLLSICLGTTIVGHEFEKIETPEAFAICCAILAIEMLREKHP